MPAADGRVSAVMITWNRRQEVLRTLGEIARLPERPAVIDAGGFRPEFGIGGEEEWVAAELAARGWWLCYVPELTVHHYPSSRRDAPGRRWQLTRNALWFAWLRRPLTSALRRTLGLARAGPFDRAALKGFAAAALSLPVMWRRRRLLPAEVERGLR